MPNRLAATAVSVTVSCVAAMAWVAPPARGENVVNDGTRRWVDAARSGRADLLVLGDSVVWHMGNGWDAGYTRAARDTLGLAGTGLMDGMGGEGEGYGIGPIFGSPWDGNPASVPADRRGYVWRDRAFTAGATPLGSFFAGAAPGTLDPSGPLDWHLWTASPAGGGSMAAYARLGAAPYTTLRTFDPVPTATPADGLQQVTFSSPAGTVAAGEPQELFLKDVTNTSIFYSRLLVPGATGATVTSWGYGGHSTRDFLFDQWLGQGVTADGRTQWFDALTGGGSGKLNVLVAEGFNDRNEDQPSANGVADGDSPEAFADNMRSLLTAIRADWSAAGRDPADLSFTLVSTYKDAHEVGFGELGQYAAELEQIATAAAAAGDDSITYVDLYAMSLPYAQAQAEGYMYDEVHVSRDGALAYSRMVMDALVPEPSGAALLLTAAAGLLGGRRRRASR
jgi:hypothetical protein